MVGYDTDVVTRDAARRGAAALRRLIASVAAGDIPSDELGAVAAELESLADRLGRFPVGNSEYRQGSDPQDTSSWERHCVLGKSNALAAPVIISYGDQSGQEVVVGECSLTQAYETPVGMIHGAPIAGILTSIVGLASEFAHQRTYVGTLSVRFIRPIPLDQPLRFEGRPVSQEGRKIFVEAKVYAGQDLVVTCEAVNIVGRDS